MTTDVLSEKLNIYSDIDKKIEILNKRLKVVLNYINDFKYSEAFPSAQNLEGMPKGSGISDSTFNAMINISNLHKKYNKDVEAIAKEINYLYDIKSKIDSILILLNKQEREIIELRHFKDKSWEWISSQVPYSRGWLPTVYQRTLLKMVVLWNRAEG